MKAPECHDSLVSLAKYYNSQSTVDRDIRKEIGIFLEGKARRCAIPLHGTFELTPLCNLDCKMCYIHLLNTNLDCGLLPTETWKNLASQAYKAGMRKVTLTGGECLTYPGFIDLFLFLCQFGMGISILTNGALLDSQHIEVFKKYPPEFIQISLYGSNENAYESVTGHRVFSRVCQNIYLLREAGLKIQISITPNRYMADDIQPLMKLVHSMHIPYQINCRLIQPRKNTGREIEDLSIDQYIEIYRTRAVLQDEELLPNDPTELPDLSRQGYSRYGLLCGAGRSSFAVSYDGRMMPCVSLYEVSEPVLELGFIAAWERIHQAAETFPIPAECGACAYFPVCIHCQAQHNNAPAGHCEPQICERTRKLAEAGFFHYKNNQKCN